MFTFFSILSAIGFAIVLCFLGGRSAEGTSHGYIVLTQFAFFAAIITTIPILIMGILWQGLIGLLLVPAWVGVYVILSIVMP